MNANWVRKSMGQYYRIHVFFFDNKTASLTSPIEGPDSANITNAGIIMKQLLSSNKPYDIATLAYIWGVSSRNV